MAFADWAKPVHGRSQEVSRRPAMGEIDSLWVVTPTVRALVATLQEDAPGPKSTRRKCPFGWEIANCFRDS
jgi:hypothetical protein